MTSAEFPLHVPRFSSVSTMQEKEAQLPQAINGSGSSALHIIQMLK